MTSGEALGRLACLRMGIFPSRRRGSDPYQGLWANEKHYRRWLAKNQLSEEALERRRRVERVLYSQEIYQSMPTVGELKSGVIGIGWNELVVLQRGLALVPPTASIARGLCERIISLQRAREAYRSVADFAIHAGATAARQAVAEARSPDNATWLQM